MNVFARNTAGSPISERGFVYCTVCGKELLTVSKEVGPQYAICPGQVHKPKEGIMPSVPKPSAKKATSTVKTKAKRPARAKVAHGEKKPREKHALVVPTKGKMGAVLTALKAAGGMTKDELDACAAQHALSAYGIQHAHYMAKRMGLLKA